MHPERMNVALSGRGRDMLQFRHMVALLKSTNGGAEKTSEKAGDPLASPASKSALPASKHDGMLAGDNDSDDDGMFTY